MRCLNLKKTEKHNINAWFTSTEVNGNFAIDFNGSLCPLIMKVARMIYTNHKESFLFHHILFCLQMHKQSTMWFVLELKNSVFGPILNHFATLGGVLLLRRSRTAHSLCGSRR